MATHVATQETQPIQKITRETIPLWLAVAVTVVVSLPFGLVLNQWGNNYNLPLWVAFIVWAEYFALGAKPSALLVILPSFILSALGTAACMFTSVVLKQNTPLDANWSLAVSLFVWVAVMVYAMRFNPTLTKGSLPYFNGISMLLAVYFTSSYPAVSDALWQPWVAALWVILAGLLGAILGWFNVTITFPHEVDQVKS